MIYTRVLCAAAALFPLSALAAPPAARVEPVTDDYYGTKVTDPYRWMESGKDPQWMPWLKAQSEHARSVLDALPGRAKLLAEISARSGGLAAVARATKAGRYFFHQERPAGAEDYRLMVRDGKGAPRLLYDPSSAVAGGMVIDDWEPSPTGDRVSYGASQTPKFRSAVLPYLDRGGVYVMANVRGGGEFGRDWHYAGKAENKATSWRDAIAVAEKLVADRMTSPKAMTILGTSAGGVTVGGAVNERPDLFSGAIANVGFMNPIRYVSEQNYADIEEWGGPIKDARTFKIMFDMDPFHHIKDGVKYPATLVVSGINDPRAATFHSAKYAARMAAASASGEPVLLRLDFDAGHGIGSSRSQSDATWADIYAFTLWQGGAPGFQPGR